MIIGTVSGRIGQDPERRATQDGTPVVSFSVASSSRKKDGPTTWVKVSLFGQQAETLAPMLHKGDRITVGGRLELRPWESNGKSGVSLELDRAEVHLVETRQESEGRPSSTPASSTRQAPPAQNRSRVPF